MEEKILNTTEEEIKELTIEEMVDLEIKIDMLLDGISEFKKKMNI